MDFDFQILVTIFCTLLASSGFWAFLMSRLDRKSVQNEMLKGLAHDRIMELSIKYIERGSITRDEYENLYTYLYVPYCKLNKDKDSSIKHIIECGVNKLEIKDSAFSK